MNSCNTCQRIYKELNLPRSVTILNIKEDSFTSELLEKLKNLAGSYEALFSRRAQLFKKRNLKERELSEQDFRILLLEHYTFLKRPVIVNKEQIFIGNSKKVVAQAKISIQNP